MSKQAVERMPAVAEPQVPAVAETTALIQMIERAAKDPNTNVEKMERLYAMHTSAVALQAKVAFDEALSDMQTELPIIVERGKIQIGTGKAQGYALWEDINEAIKPILTKHGFALRFVTGQQDGKIIVTGVLSRGGHREETTMHLPLDVSGSKNAVQAVGSSTSYGKRYTAAALLNLTSRGEDDDGQKGGAGEPISETQLQELRALLEETKSDIPKFCAYMKIPSLAEMPARMFEQAMDAARAKKKKS